MTHTPTPWMPGEKRSYRCVGATSDDRDWTRWIIVGEAHVVARVHGRTEEECNDNHDIIVTAVNTHAALRDALRDIADDTEEFSHGDTNLQRWVRGFSRKARAALAQCGGE